MIIGRFIKGIIRNLHINDVVCLLLYHFKKEIVCGDDDAARKTLYEYCKNPNGTSFGKNEICKYPNYDLQIVIPVYNVEKYVKECLDSVKKQVTSYRYKVVIVDDGSIDNSATIIDSYKADNWEIIHKQNGGLSSARNEGIRKIDARYIMFLDSDDYLPAGALQSMLDVAYRYDADLVQGGTYRALRNEKLIDKYRYKKMHPIVDLKESQGFAWGKIYKNNLFSEIVFPVGYLFEDTMISFMIFTTIRDGYYIPAMTYVYRDNETSITNTLVNNPRVVETYWITEKMIIEFKERGITESAIYREMVLNQIICNCRRLIHLPESIQKDVFILSCNLIESYPFNEMNIKRHKLLYRALKQHDYGNYIFYCMTR